MNIFYRKTTVLLTLLLTVIALAEGRQQRQVKHATFPEGASLEQKTVIAANLVPSPQQLEWQKMEMTAFLHFGINTFTGREWGDGTEDPALFYPTEFDARQWAKTLKEAGFKMAIITAKHHDGFCLWPTKTTDHSVASSKWKDGKGDVVRELRDACEEFGLKFGVYISPWDRHAPCYGDSETYNKYFIEQLTELLTDYGTIHEVWFDGACGEGPNGKKQIYDWDAFYNVIKKYQPDAVNAIMGDDVRWVGNERGMGREMEWSATVLTPGVYSRAQANNKKLLINQKSTDLGSREILEKAGEIFWYPSEVDVSIRPGWFFHSNENDQVKNLKQLSEIYFKSVGYNSVLLLNIPPDTRGLIHENDARALAELQQYISNTFATDYVKGCSRFSIRAGGCRELKLKEEAWINLIQVQEDITKGQRIENITIEVRSNKCWKKVAQGTTVGYKRIFRFPDIKADAIRINIDGCRAKANISRVSVHFAEDLDKKDKWVPYASNEFNWADCIGSRPWGFVQHNGRAMSRSAKIDNEKCSEVTPDGILRIWCVEEKDSVDNGFGKKVKYSHACFRSATPESEECWCNFGENMRIEVRMRRSNNVGFNNALWFMGNNKRPWPSCGEIDLMENPQKTVNHTAHFTLHSENHYAGVVGGKGSITASHDVGDMTQWNTYWMEWYPDRIVGGVNDCAYFEHHKGDDGNLDWPWSDPEGFYMIISTGISDQVDAWPGAVNAQEWDPANPPCMEIDWIRVYCMRSLTTK